MTVDDYRATLDAGTLALVDALRHAIIEAEPALEESIKWNAPSFAHRGEDRITLGIERRGGVRVVLHRGAKVSAAPAPAAIDTDRLAKWPAPDRGVLVFTDSADIAARRPPLIALCRRWLAAT